MNRALWVVQALLAVAFFFSGFGKMTQSAEELLKNIPWAPDVPVPVIRFIGAAEVFGSVGMIVPSALRMVPKLTVFAAVGLSVVMLLAAGFHISRSEPMFLPINVLLGGLAVFVAWGRWKKAPIPAR